VSGWIVDTNVLSELRKGARCKQSVKVWAEAQPAHRLFLSRISVAEIRYGIEETGNQQFRQELTQWLETNLLRWFSGRILEVDEAVIVEWRRMVEKGRKSGHTYSEPDLFIAATASIHGLGVATRNVDDFKRAGVAVVNPWIEEKGRG
jgi:predicted nucleic acid-binding protein